MIQINSKLVDGKVVHEETLVRPDSIEDLAKQDGCTNKVTITDVVLENFEKCPVFAAVKEWALKDMKAYGLSEEEASNAFYLIQNPIGNDYDVRIGRGYVIWVYAPDIKWTSGPKGKVVFL